MEEVGTDVNTTHAEFEGFTPFVGICWMKD